MSKKFGKFLLATAALTTAAAAAYYYLHKKDSVCSFDPEEEEDFDNFSKEAVDTDAASRNYVQLNKEDAAKTASAEEPAETVEEVEEFFDEEDSTNGEPPVQD